MENRHFKVVPQTRRPKKTPNTKVKRTKEHVEKLRLSRLKTDAFKVDSVALIKKLMSIYDITTVHDLSLILERRLKLREILPEANKK